MDSESLPPAPESQPLPSADQPVDLRAEVSSLYGLLQGTMIFTIIVGAALLWFLRNQVITMSQDIQGARMMWTNTMVNAQRVNPIMDETVKKLQDFSRSNADFGQFLAKYGLKPGQPGATPVPAGKK